MIRTTGTSGLGWIDRMLNPPTRQMRREGSPTVGTGLALGALLALGGVRWLLGRLVGRTGLGLLFLSLRRRIPRPLLLGQLFSSFAGRLRDPRLQFPGVDFFRARAKEVPLVNRHHVLQIAPDLLQFLHPLLQGLGLGLQLPRPGDCLQILRLRPLGQPST